MDAPFSALTIHMFIPSYPKANVKPKLKLKAAKGRYFLRVLRYMLENMFALRTEHQQLRLRCLTALVKVYEEIDVWKDDTSSAVKVAELGRQHLILYHELHDLSLNACDWWIYPKHHIFAHFAARCTVNPKLEWNYADESEMGFVSTLAAVSNQGAIETALLRRYRLTFDPNF